ncbi:MAG: AMP-binding protein [Mariprofundales bacterium]|nr:AMP-binding protein [Mariprofundales bacterium]
MNILQQQLTHWQRVQPAHHALEGQSRSGDPVAIPYGQLNSMCRATARLWDKQSRVIAMMCDNTPDTILLDIAMMAANISTVPIPPFFTPQQTQHLLRQAGVEIIITDDPERIEGLLQQIGITIVTTQREEGCCVSLHAYHIDNPTDKQQSHFDKITFTSGSTGNPKGVCLGNRALLTVAESLQQATEANREDRHLALLPYATLLESIGGILVPLLAGATIIHPTLARVGMSGSSSLDSATMVKALQHYRASSCIMVPQMLLALTTYLTANPEERPEHLRFVAVGGATISPALLTRAQELGIAVFEGYGLSEAASVVAVNTPSAHKIGSVGKPLPHVELRTDSDGELWVKGALMEGYLDNGVTTMSAKDSDGFWPTGDIGAVDSSGFLHITGRKKQIFITAFGRNVAPEWVERELTIEPEIAQAALFGDGKPFNVAVVVARNPQTVHNAIERANSRLPDYAKVTRFILANEPFSITNRQAAINGSPHRAEIARAYQQEIARCYSKEKR